jgi:hypothetical protein
MAGTMPFPQIQPDARFSPENSQLLRPRDTGYSDPNIEADQRIKAARLALQDGDQEAHDVLMQEAADFYSKASGTAADGMSGGEAAAAGFGQGVTNVARHLRNKLIPDNLPNFSMSPQARGGMPGSMPTPGRFTDEQMADAQKMDAPLLDTEGGAAGSFMGETAALAPLGGPVSGAAARTGAFAARQLSKPIVRGAFEGSAQGALMADPGNSAQGAMVGAGAGAILPAAVTGAKKLVRGMDRTPEAQALLDRGVDLTPGRMNPTGAYNQFEEAAENAPLVGNMVKGARDNTQLTFSKAGIREAAPAGATIPDGTPQEMLDAAYRAFEPLYDQAKGFPLVLQGGKPVIVNQGANTPLALELTAITRKGSATKGVRDKVATFLNNEFSRDLKTSDDLLKMRSSVRTRARKARQSTGDSNENEDTAALLDKAEAALTRALDSQLPPDAMKVLRDADKAYGNYKVYEDAMYRAKDQKGGFTPSQLSAASRDSQPEGAYARGAGGAPRELATQGVKTMEVQTPPTGARGAFVAATIPTMGLNYGVPALLSGTKTGRRFAAGMTKPQQAVLAMAQDVAKHVDPDQRRRLAAVVQAAIVNSGAQNSRVSE